MYFTWNKTPGRVYNGPDKSDGLLSCWTMGTLKSFRAALKLDRLDDLEMVEINLMYYVLSVRAEGGDALLPFRMWPDLKLGDFRIAPHEVESYDDDGDCGNCNMKVDNPVHTGVAVPPTTPAPQTPEAATVDDAPGPPPMR